jgi:hypothetical protein
MYYTLRLKNGGINLNFSNVLLYTRVLLTILVIFHILLRAVFGFDKQYIRHEQEIMQDLIFNVNNYI